MFDILQENVSLMRLEVSLGIGQVPAPFKLRLCGPLGMAVPVIIMPNSRVSFKLGAHSPPLSGDVFLAICRNAIAEVVVLFSRSY